MSQVLFSCFLLSCFLSFLNKNTSNVMETRNFFRVILSSFKTLVKLGIREKHTSVLISAIARCSSSGRVLGEFSRTKENAIRCYFIPWQLFYLNQKSFSVEPNQECTHTIQHGQRIKMAVRLLLMYRLHPQRLEPLT